MPYALAAAVAFAMVVAGCGPAPDPAGPKLVILGFDGLDAELTERWMAAGLLPNMTRLAAEGGMARVETTPGAETSSAWITLATGAGAGVHGVFDRAGWDGSSALIRPTPPRMLFDRWPIGAAGFAPARPLTPFWTVAAAAGVRASVLAVPGTFPPEPLPGGELMSGFPLPAIDDSPGTYGYFATDLHDLPADAGAFPAVRQRLEFVNRVAHGTMPGLQRPRTMPVPFRVTWNREARTANVDVAGETLHLSEGQWSRWVAVRFPLGAFVEVQGMLQFYLHRAGTALQLYASPLQWHPADPPAPLSSPAGFAAELYERLGPFRTLPTPGTAWALANGDIEEQVFLDDLDRAFDDRAALILNRIDQSSWDFLIGVVEATDDVQHVMWRLIDPFHPAYDPDLAPRLGGAIQRLYRRADELVGQVRSRLPRGAVLIVLSAYGFHPFRASVDLNAWLAGRGELTPAAGVRFPETIDWSRTRAYSLGAGQVFVNLRGRQPHGIVAPGTERDALVAKLRAGLEALVDPSTGRAVAGRVESRDDLYRGPRLWDAPDLTVGFAHGYRASQAAMIGRPSRGTIAANHGRWSGDHASLDRLDTPGVFIASARPSVDRIRVQDIAATVLAVFGLRAPSTVEGRTVLGAVPKGSAAPAQ